MPVVFLGLGTNLGDRKENLQNAISALSKKIYNIQESPIYETAPWGFENQPTFFNMTLKAETDLAPFDLLKHLKTLETKLGRTPTFRYGPRMIDIDILFYDDLVLQTSELTIPHPKLHERTFVLVPLADIAPDLKHPVFKQTIPELINQLDPTEISFLS